MSILFLVNVVLVITILSSAVFAWKYAKKIEDMFKSNRGSKIYIKIDRTGKYHHELIPESGDTNLLFWLRLCILVLAILLLIFPLSSIFNRS